jgi:hypothetical protein
MEYKEKYLILALRKLVVRKNFETLDLYIIMLSHLQGSYKKNSLYGGTYL